MSTYFTWLAREGLVESNPIAFTNQATEGGRRSRVLTDNELAAIWRCAGDGQFGSIVRLLMLLGLRRDEVASLRWPEIDLDAALITLPGARTKNGQAHQIPLPPPAVEILRAQPCRLQSDGTRRDLVFGFGDRGYQGWSKSRRELDARLESRRHAGGELVAARFQAQPEHDDA